MKHSELRHQPRHVNPRIQDINYDSYKRLYKKNPVNYVICFKPHGYHRLVIEFYSGRTCTPCKNNNIQVYKCRISFISACG